MKNINRYIDHTLLHPTASPTEIKRVCAEAIQNNFYAVCVAGCYVALAKSALDKTAVQIAAVVGFPLGNASIETKVAEAKYAIADGADEIDVVFAVGKFLAGDYDYISQELTALRAASKGKILKVIIEVCYLDAHQIKKATELVLEANADFVKTSTGFGTGGATKEAVSIMKSVGGTKLAVKASGGIRDMETAQQYIQLGATRIGTSSGLAILSASLDQNSSSY